MKYLAQGVIRNVPQSDSVWLVVKYESYYWPEFKLPAGASFWTQYVIFGDQNHIGQVFTLLVVQADPTADQQFHDWNTATNGVDRPPGLSEAGGYPALDSLTLSSVDVMLAAVA